MTFVEYDHMIHAVTPNRTNESLNIWVLPRRLWSNWNFLDTHIPDALLEDATVDSVAITNQKSQRCIVRKGLDHLLRSPVGCRMSGDIEMHDMSAILAEDNEGEQNAERGRRNGEEIDGDNVSSMIVEKGPPSL